MKITIRARFSDDIKFEGEYTSTRHACESNKANLRGADLYGASLRGADLYGANLYGANQRGANLYGEKLIVQPVFISGLRWEITISAEYLQIGCERHTHKEWAEFKRPRISAMDKGAYDWWKAHKDMLLGLCKLNAEAAEKERPAFEKYCAEQEALNAKESAA